MQEAPHSLSPTNEQIHTLQSTYTCLTGIITYLTAHQARTVI